MSIGGSDRFLVMRGIIRQAGEKAETTKSQNRGNLKDLQAFFGEAAALGTRQVAKHTILWIILEPLQLPAQLRAG
jgi:hypothetical protein